PQSHLAANPLVIGLRHEAAQRRKTSVEEKLKITELSRGEIPGRQSLGLGLDLPPALGINVKVDKLATVGNGRVSGGSAFQTIHRFVVHQDREKEGPNRGSVS